MIFPMLGKLFVVAFSLMISVFAWGKNAAAPRVLWTFGRASVKVTSRFVGRVRRFYAFYFLRLLAFGLFIVVTHGGVLCAFCVGVVCVGHGCGVTV